MNGFPMYRPQSFLLLTILLAGCYGGPKVAEDAPRRVFFITVDTLRADHMSLYGYARQTSPEMARLAAGGVVFDRAIAQWPKTGASFASLFTGQYPQTTGLTHRAAIRIPEEYLTLPELFQESGYTTLGVTSNAVLSAELGWNDGFDELLETWGGGDFPEDPHVFRELIHAPRVNELALPLLEKHAQTKETERLFVWLHYTDPHAPYMLPDGVSNPFLGDALFQGETEVPRKAARGPYRLDGRTDLKYYVAQYDANVLVTDVYIRRVLDRARELGLLEDSLIVFTADHGESLGEHGSWFEHGPLPYNTTAHVPLFFVRDGLPAGTRIGNPVELVDLYPTLRDLVVPGYEVPGLEGHSLLPLMKGQPSDRFRLAFSEAGEKPRHFRSVQDGRWKMVLGLGGRRTTGLELYDLIADPLETSNLATKHPEELRRLRAELMRWVKNRPGRHAGQEEDEETEKALRALGYVN